MLDLFFPPTCIGCEALVSTADPVATLCARCRPEVQPAPPASEHAAVSAVFSYDGPLRHALHRLKYQRRLGYAPPLGRLLATSRRLTLQRFDLVTPVPLHSSRLRERGFNQAAMILRAAVATWTREERRRVQDRLLVRHRATASQAGLPRCARPPNVAGAFCVAPRFVACLRGARVLVVDDVLTTGATLAACCGVLRDAGAEPYALALLQSVA